MDAELTIEGHLVVYYQHDHGKGQKLLDAPSFGFD